MDYSYTHDDETMLIFDLYKTMIDETGYGTIPPEHKTFDELNRDYAFYSRLFAMLDKFGYISSSVRKCIFAVLAYVHERAILEQACEAEELEEYESDIDSFEEREVFNDGYDG